jgi:(p)ppGpp synthase/HD superfamily hydrolase
VADGSIGYLRTMPLHAITEVHGEQGLRDRFTLEIADMPAADRDLLERALALAARLHRDDRRIREPYVNHLLRVAIRIRYYYRVDDPDVLAAALLHDAVEDHADQLGGGTEAALAVLAREFNPRVAELVGAVTNPEYRPDRDEYEQYREHVADSLEANPWARVIKLSDFTDNGTGVIHATGPKVHSAATKYAPLVPVLRELVVRADTPLSGEVRRHILDQLDLAEERFAAILTAD